MGTINKQMDIISDCYTDYLKQMDKTMINNLSYVKGFDTKIIDDSTDSFWNYKEFINKIKTDNEFAKKWGNIIQGVEVDVYGEAYRNYYSKSKDIGLPENLYNRLIDDLNKSAMFPIDNPTKMLTQEEFINKIKTDDEFAKTWGLKIEKRDLIDDERQQLL